MSAITCWRSSDRIDSTVTLPRTRRNAEITTVLSRCSSTISEPTDWKKRNGLVIR
jgi:hypothetical protein